MSNISCEGLFFQKIQQQVYFLYCITPSHGCETFLSKRKYVCHLYYIFPEKGGRAVLDISLILFVKSELLCRRFVPLRNSKILFKKNTLRSNCHLQTRAPSYWSLGPFLCSYRHYVPPITLF